MKMRLQVAVSVLFVLVATSCSKESIDNTNDIISENKPQMEEEILALVNNHRQELGYAPLQFSSVAYEYANSHTDYMIARGSLSHDNFNIRASNISKEVNAETVAENVARDYPSAQQTFNSWIESATHRSTLEGEFTHTAVSVKTSPGGQLYYTQLFYR